MVAESVILIVHMEFRPYRRNSHYLVSGWYWNRVTIYNQPVTSKGIGRYFVRRERHKPFLGSVPTSVQTNGDIQHLGLLEEAHLQLTAQQSKTSEIV